MKWFYISQHVEGRAVPCDVAQIPEFNPHWSEKPSLDEMSQVRELLELIDLSKLDGVIVTLLFATRRIQPMKDRVNYVFEFQGKDDPSRDIKEDLGRDECCSWILKLFVGFDGRQFPKPPVKPYGLSFPPPSVCPWTFLCDAFLFLIDNAHVI